MSRAILLYVPKAFDALEIRNMLLVSGLDCSDTDSSEAWPSFSVYIQGIEIPIEEIPVTESVLVDGMFEEFDLDPARYRVFLIQPREIKMTGAKTILSKLRCMDDVYVQSESVFGKLAEALDGPW
jgi:hypothetical protein